MLESPGTVASVAAACRPSHPLSPTRLHAVRRHWDPWGSSLVFIVIWVVVLLSVPSVPTGPVRSAFPEMTSGTPRSGIPSGAGVVAGISTGAAPTASVLGKSVAWSLLSPSAPGSRAGAGFAASSSTGEGVLFGGRTSAGLINSTLLYNESQNRWRTLQPATAPTARSDFGFASDPVHGSAVLFGGLVDPVTNRVSNDTWIFSFGTDNWTNVTPAVSPAPRSDAALAIGDGAALLYGGEEPNASGVGQLVYYDTWLLNLTTDLWTRVNLPGPPEPGPLYGASLVWNPDPAVFLLFGGCEPCSDTVWAFSPVSQTWSTLASSSPPPRARMSAVWSWDPMQRIDLLFGGRNSTDEFNDTYLFDPTSSTWTRVTTPLAPSPRSEIAADFLAVPANETLLVTGGTDGASILPDVWRLSPVANLTVWVTNVSSGQGIANATVGVEGEPFLVTNSAGAAQVNGVPATETTVNAGAPGFLSLGLYVWISPAENVTVWLNLTPLPPATVYVRVADSNGAPLPNVSVSVSFGVHLLRGSPHPTNETGVANFTQVPSAVGTVSATFARFHTNNSAVYFPPGQTVWVNLTLNPLLELLVHTIGELPNGTVTTLQGVSIAVQGREQGTTDREGWLNVTTTAFGMVEIEASVYGFVTASKNITANYTGGESVVLTLSALPFPAVSVEVLGVTGSPVDLLVRHARVLVLSTTSLPTGSFRETYSTGIDGTVSFFVPPGNYSFHVSALGFGDNNSVPITFARVSASINLIVHLEPLPLSTFHVLVRSTAGDHPTIPGASVSVRFTNVSLADGSTFPELLLVNTSRSGWANFSGLPASELFIFGSAPGYYPNETIVSIGYGENLTPFVLELAPTPPVRSVSLSILPGGPDPILALVLLPIVSLVGALVYLTMLRNPSPRDRTGETDLHRPSEGAGGVVRP